MPSSPHSFGSHWHGLLEWNLPGFCSKKWEFAHNSTLSDTAGPEINHPSQDNHVGLCKIRRRCSRAHLPVLPGTFQEDPALSHSNPSHY